MTRPGTPSEAPDNAVSDVLYSGAPGEGSTPADGPQWRDRGAIIATLTAEVEQLKDAEAVAAQVRSKTDEEVIVSQSPARKRARAAVMRSARGEARDRALGSSIDAARQ